MNSSMRTKDSSTRMTEEAAYKIQLDITLIERRPEDSSMILIDYLIRIMEYSMMMKRMA